MNSTANLTSNPTNLPTYYDLEFWYFKIGSLFFLDYVIMFILTPISLVAIALNILTFSVLNHKTFKGSAFFTYMRYYSLNNTVLAFFVMTTFITSTKRIFKFTNTYEAYVFGCYIYNPVMEIFYLNSSLLEISMVVERVLFFLPPRYLKFRIAKIRMYCLILFFFSASIGWALSLFFEPGHLVVSLNKNTKYDIYFWKPTVFSKTSLGNIVSYVVYFVRDIFTLMLKIIFNIILVVLARSYVNKIMVENMNFALKISSGSQLHSKKIGSKKDKNGKLISKTDRYQAYYAFFMCLFSFFENFFAITSFFFYFFNLPTFSPYLTFLSMFSRVMKHILNFCMFSKFNNLFRIGLKRTFKALNLFKKI